MKDYLDVYDKDQAVGIVTWQKNGMTYLISAAFRLPTPPQELIYLHLQCGDRMFRLGVPEPCGSNWCLKKRLSATTLRDAGIELGECDRAIVTANREEPSVQPEVPAITPEAVETFEPLPSPAPMPRPEPIPMPMPMPEPVPMPMPRPEPIPMPMPRPEPIPMPMPMPEPETMPKPEPTPMPEPVPMPTPEPEPVPMPMPMPEPETCPEPTPRPDCDWSPVQDIDAILSDTVLAPLLRGKTTLIVRCCGDTTQLAMPYDILDEICFTPAFCLMEVLTIDGKTYFALTLDESGWPIAPIDDTKNFQL